MTSSATPHRPSWGRVPFDIRAREPWLRVPFSREEYEARWGRLAQALDEGSLDAVVVLGGPGDCGQVRYLTNFESYVGYTAVVITRKGQCALATNSLMRGEPMHSSIWMTYVEDVRPTMPRRYAPEALPLEAKVAEILADYGVTGRVAYSGTISRDMWNALEQAGGGEPPDFSAQINTLMGIKSANEITLIRRANVVAENAFAAVRSALRVGVRETELAAAAFAAMMAGGGEGPSFSLALAGGPRSGLKHALPSDYALRDGDIFFMDFGLVLEGYVTDTARTAIVGTGSDEAMRFVRCAEQMTRAALSVASPGTSQSVLDDAAFQVACDAGFAQDYYFRAHGVGTTLFQPPRFYPGDHTTLREGEVFSLEPMLARLGFGSACVEQTVLVTPTGREVLSGGDGIWLDGR